MFSKPPITAPTVTATIAAQYLSFTTFTPRKPRILLPPTSAAAITTTSMFSPASGTSALYAIPSPLTRKSPVVKTAPKASASVATTTVTQSKSWPSSNRLGPTASPPPKFVKPFPSHSQPRAAVQHTTKPSTTTNHQHHQLPTTTEEEFDVYEFLED
jgi:hypothetical protein